MLIKSLILIFACVIWTPLDPNETIIYGNVECVHKNSPEPDRVTHENIAVYLINAVYFYDPELSFQQKVEKYSDMYITDSNGNYYLFAEPKTNYVIVYVIGVKATYDYEIITPVQGRNKREKYTLEYHKKFK